MQFTVDNRPFAMDGRTFLPVRAIAEAVNMPVDFDASTNTVYLGGAPVSQSSALQRTALFFGS